MTRVVQLMSVFPICVDARAPAEDALASAELFGVHHLMALDGGEIAGVVCRCDLAHAGSLDSVANSMRAPAVTIAPDDGVDFAADLMLRRGVGCLPVVDDAGVLRGVVTRRDLRAAGILPDRRGGDRCSECGTSRPLIESRCPDAEFLCVDCLGEVVTPAA